MKTHDRQTLRDIRNALHTFAAQLETSGQLAYRVGDSDAGESYMDRAVLLREAEKQAAKAQAGWDISGADDCRRIALAALDVSPGAPEAFHHVNAANILEALEAAFAAGVAAATVSGVRHE